MKSVVVAFLVIFQIVSSGDSYAQEQRIFVGTPTRNPGPFNVSGTVKDSKTSETLVGATIIIEGANKNTTTNENGKFNLLMEKGYYSVQVSFVGFQTKVVEISVRNSGSFLIELPEEAVQMDEVVVYSEGQDANVRGNTLGKTNLSIESIEALPPFAGELDVLKSITLLPGISTVGESSSGFNVRGGGADQNLIILDRVTLYNPSHLFGFFSSFNSDVLSGVTVYKGGIPANYGGRGSSIIDLTYKKGNSNKWEGKASLGTISTKLQLNGPIINNKLTVLVGGRSSYSNWLLDAVQDPQIGNSSASFYDANALLHFDLNANNILEYSFYRSHDNFKLLSDTTYAWENQGHALKWNHTINKETAINISVIRSEYGFSINNSTGVENFDLRSGINEHSINLDFLSELGKWGSVSFGAQGKMIQINPGALTPVGSASSIVPKTLELEQGIETGLYFQHDLGLLKDKIGVSYGLRYSRYFYVGGNSIFSYAQHKPRSEENITGSTFFDDFEVINTYHGFEPRVSLRYSLNKTTSIKAGFNRINQYIHLISNTAAIAPTDIWKLSDPYLKPQTVTQFSVGFFQNFKNNGIESSLEVYYKNQANIIEYKDGASLILNNHLETELLNGQGKSYGLELYFRRKIGFLRGWVGYTYSRSLRQVIGAFPEELINHGEWFPSNFDKPHDLTTTVELQFSPNVKFSGILTYSTGRAISYPSAKFNYFGNDIAYFEKRNDERAPDYMRVDASWNFKLNSKKKLFSGELTFAIFNLLGRKNAFSVFFKDTEGAPPQAYKLSVLGIPFPSLSYSIKF